MPSSSSSVFLPPAQTRLVTIVAHVDHGKTTLADHLIQANGIISESLAGKLRYLDSDPEEQRRGITMKSSAIGLKHRYSKSRVRRKLKQKKQQQQQTDKDESSSAAAPPSEDILVHLVDSPGHSDFAAHVTSALHLCDAALVVVDVVEGMCARTHQVLRDALAEGLRPVLVLNKLDRLCTHLQLDPTEAHVRLRTLVETVNAAASVLLTSSRHVEDKGGGKDDKKEAKGGSTSSCRQKKDCTENDNELLERWWTFDPAQGNVLFVSAWHGWGFSVPALARALYQQQTVQVPPRLLRQYLFGSDYKLSPTDKSKILKIKPGASNQRSLFVQFALEPLWDIYSGVAQAVASVTGTANKNTTQNGASRSRIVTADTPGMRQVIEALKVGATGATMQESTVKQQVESVLSHTGAKTEEAVLRALLRRYRPLAETVLDTIAEYCPSPVEAASTRARAFFSDDSRDSTEENDGYKRIRQAVETCDAAPEAPAVAHVCKFLATDRDHIQGGDVFNNVRPVILGVARVLSGRLRSGREYYMLPPGQKSTAPASPPQKQKIQLYLLMGSSFLHVSEVPAGHLCAIANLDGAQLKSMTLSNSPLCMPLLAASTYGSSTRPLVKVNVEPENAADTDALEAGLVKLNLVDEAVEVRATTKGERFLSCLGELHLEQSILELEKYYCGREVKLRVSDPIVDFAETTEWFDNETGDYTAFYDDPSPPLRQTTIPPYNEEEGLAHAKRGRTRAVLSGRCGAISLRVVPLVEPVHRSLTERTVVDGSEEELLKMGKALGYASELTAESVLNCLLEALCSLDDSGNALVQTPGILSGRCIRGVETASEEVYVPTESIEDNDHGHSARDGIEEYRSVQECIRLPTSDNNDVLEPATDADTAARDLWVKEMKSSAVAGFQLALRAGPVCEEPMRNILVVVEGIEMVVTRKDDGSYKPTSAFSGGMVVSALKTGVRSCLLTRPVRLTEGHFRLTLHSSLAGLGQLYNILSKRRGKVVEDSMVDGTDLLMITATIPQAEAFGLAPELFRKTSGEVTAPEMIFSHYERLDADPFWIPTTEEEREDFGELQNSGDSSTGLDNTALKYIRQVRARKGLVVDSSRTVSAADKQRTLKR